MPAADKLATYRRKRDFGRTPEPAGTVANANQQLQFVVQKHAASRLHYDFRLELDGVMLSWALPKGPSFDPKDKRLAVQVEDHPLSYNSFEGTIPKGQYGAGTVIVWDRGTWTPQGDPHAGLAAGKLLFTLDGHKLAGLWELVRIAKGGEKQPPWILFKKHDAFERPHAAYDVISALPDSVVSKPPATRPVPAAATPHGGHADAAPLPRLDTLPKATLPARLSPQLATLATAPPSSAGGVHWIYEIKFDGYRLLARVDAKGRPRLFTRNGHDWTDRMPQLAADLAAMPGLRDTWLDGEIVVLDRHGVPDFNALQRAFDSTVGAARRERTGRRAGAPADAASPIVYFLFDLPFHAGRDLREQPLVRRRALLQQRLQAAGSDDDHPHIRLSADFVGNPADILASAAKLKLEGLIAKRADAPYVSARAPTWLKLKCRQRQEFIVAGFTDRGSQRDAAEIGSLLLGVVDDDGVLVSVGSVGTGWDSATAGALKARLLTIERPAPAFGEPVPSGTGRRASSSRRPAGAPSPPANVPQPGRWSKRKPGAERWVEPVLVAEVQFAEWTPDGQIRHASFVSLRDDKAAAQVVRENAASAPRAASRSAPSPSPSTMKITHPERVVDQASGLTKLDLVRYYESVSAWMLPHLKGRPCSLVRGPGGIGGQLFFQKHADTLSIPGLKQLPPGLMPDHEPLIEVPNARALLGAAQMNVIEFHTCNARARQFDHPDRLIFDLDPGQGVAWNKVQEAAALLHSFLADLGLKSWLKTSGGKGLHVVVPVAAKHDWATVKDFSRDVVQHMARVIPERFVAKSGPANRVGRIFIDYLRNSRGATTVAAFSARTRPGLGVSMPVDWSQLNELKSGAQWTIATAREHLSFQHDDPWAAYWTSRQTLTRAIQRLGDA